MGLDEAPQAEPVHRSENDTTPHIFFVFFFVRTSGEVCHGERERHLDVKDQIL
jgi:hypothetical protein